MTASHTTPADSETSDLELQLANKIAAILAEPPIHKNPLIEALKQPLAETDAPDETYQQDICAEDFQFPAQSNAKRDELTMLEGDSPVRGLPEEEGEEEAHPVIATPPPLPKAKASSHSDLTNTTIIKKAQRARNNKRARQAGSWFITLSVTLFITACVSVLLLGVPKSFDPQAWMTAHLFTTDAAKTKVTAPATTGSLRTPDK